MLLINHLLISNDVEQSTYIIKYLRMRFSWDDVDGVFVAWRMFHVIKLFFCLSGSVLKRNLFQKFQEFLYKSETLLRILKLNFHRRRWKFNRKFLFQCHFYVKHNSHYFCILFFIIYTINAYVYWNIFDTCVYLLRYFMCNIYLAHISHIFGTKMHMIYHVQIICDTSLHMTCT